MPEIDKAKQAGMLVVALDTPTDPADAVDATFATDNYQAGLLIGQWAKSSSAPKPRGQDRHAGPERQPASPSTCSATRASCEGFGIDVADKTQIGDESDPRDRRPRRHRRRGTAAAPRWRTSAEGPDINLVYTINEPAAAGAYQALKAAGKEKSVTIVSVDGGCPGVEAVKAGSSAPRRSSTR